MILANLFCLLMGFALLSRHFEESHVPAKLPDYLPDDWRVNPDPALIDRELALCLYTAIFTDTGSFRYTNTTPESMRIAASLVEAGAVACATPWTSK